jgi:phosphoribosyl-ATP pyrophosphohydrolase
MPESDSGILERLYAVIESRREADPQISYVARLLRKGTPKLAQKVGEEAVEAVIAATLGNNAELIDESADLLFHLLVLWAAAGVHPQAVWQELARREGISGLDAKKAKPAEK